MKPPPTTTTTQVPPPSKPNSAAATNTTSNNLTTLFYEPTSVLDPNLNSSPASSAPTGSDPLLDLPAPPSSDPFDDWDPLTFWLLDKDSNISVTTPPSSQLHHHLPDPFDFLPSPALDLDSLFPNPTPPSLPPPPPPAFEQPHLDLLIRAAQAVECNDLNLAGMILARLNHHLPSPSGRPLQRAACYFKEALQSLLLVDAHLDDDPFLLHPCPLEVVRKITAYKALSDLSPVPQFTSFTANQTILEAVTLSDGGSPRPIHLLDFDIGLGGQWSSFMQEVATRCRTYRVTSPSVRITAVVPDESLETNLIADNLRDFARSLGISFSIEFVRVGDMGPAALTAVRLAAGDSVAVSFTPAILRLLGGGGADSVGAFLRFVCRASPRVAIFVDAESCCSDSGPHQSFRRSFVTGLEYYTVVLESLDSAAAAVGLGDDKVGRIEKSLIRPKVWASRRSWGLRALPWREMLERAGLKPVPFSEVTESQAEWLTRHAQVGGFHVASRDGMMVLSWQGRELASTSAWRCC